MLLLCCENDFEVCLFILVTIMPILFSSHYKTGTHGKLSSHDNSNSKIQFESYGLMQNAKTPCTNWRQSLNRTKTRHTFQCIPAGNFHKIKQRSRRIRLPRHTIAPCNNISLKDIALFKLGFLRVTVDRRVFVDQSIVLLFLAWKTMGTKTSCKEKTNFSIKGVPNQGPVQGCPLQGSYTRSVQQWHSYRVRLCHLHPQCLGTKVDTWQSILIPGFGEFPIDVNGQRSRDVVPRLAHLQKTVPFN